MAVTSRKLMHNHVKSNPFSLGALTLLSWHFQKTNFYAHVSNYDQKCSICEQNLKIMTSEEINASYLPYRVLDTKAFDAKNDWLRF
jgi:hypothetical protein